MPELPEVETVRRGLEPVLTGATIARVQLNRADLRWPFPPDMAARLTGARIERLGRRSKVLLAALSTGETLLIHLGMSGRMIVSGTSLGNFAHAHAAAQKHDHVVIELADGARVTFNDPRRFGAMDLIDSAALDHHRLLRRLGPEPLGNGLNAAYLSEAFRGRRSTIKAALLDQHVIAGLGNIYVAEALFQAGIHPMRAAGRIGPARLERLVAAIRQVLTEAIAAGGSSLRDFRHADGELGYFQHRFAVYDRAGHPCPRPGCRGQIRRIVQAGRSTFYCPSCQR